MKIQEFAQNYCSNLLRVVDSKSLYDKVKEKDDLPYDAIRISEDGILTKVVYIDDNDRFMDIYELISYSKEDILATKDVDLIQVWNNYMALLDDDEISLSDTLRLAREWRMLRDKEEQNAGLLS